MYSVYDLRSQATELPTVSLLFLAVAWAFVTAVHGVTPVAPEGRIVWNIHEWELR